MTGTGMWQSIGGPLTPRSNFAVILLGNHDGACVKLPLSTCPDWPLRAANGPVLAAVLVVGGRDAGGQQLSSVESWNAGTRTWTATGGMTTPRVDCTLTLLPNGDGMHPAAAVISEFATSLSYPRSSSSCKHAGVYRSLWSACYDPFDLAHPEEAEMQ